jgi:hypothetical protein
MPPPFSMSKQHIFLLIWFTFPSHIRRIQFLYVLLMDQLKVGMPLENIGWVGLIWNLVKPVLLFDLLSISLFSFFKQFKESWNTFLNFRVFWDTVSPVYQLRVKIIQEILNTKNHYQNVKINGIMFIMENFTGKKYGLILKGWTSVIKSKNSNGNVKNKCWTSSWIFDSL